MSKRREEFYGSKPLSHAAAICTYDAKFTEGPICGKPATWHAWPGTPPETREPFDVYACDAHWPILDPKRLWDYHRLGGACGIPGARWYAGARQGQGLCRHDLDDETLTAALADPEGQALVQAIHDRKLNR
ncbi:hypothetical protein [Arthrobacter sp. B1805]|uniref:hypothetical protein n=1 Tax=Arthrobacter sp. B1805 TaxID=2058892 RepID=UPI000CE3EF4F|nr:hypothetical protein [Arthrobacter sp. B1805]